MSRYRALPLAAALAWVCVSLPAQTVRWARQFGTSGTEIAYAVAAAGGGVYVAGEILNGAFPGAAAAGGRDAFLARYDQQGNQLWVRQFGSSADDTALGVAADDVAVYVVGRTAGALAGQTSSGSTDAFVRKFTPDGAGQWTRQFGSAAFDEALAAAVVPAGLYVAGRTAGAFPGQTSASPGTDDAFLARFDEEGNQWWVRQFGSAAADRANGVASDASGAYVAGSTQGALAAPAAGTDAFLRKYDDQGNVLWTRQITSAGSANDIAYGVAANRSAVYVCGETAGIFAGQSRISGTDAWAQRYNPDGALLWTRQFGTTFNDTGYGIAAAQWIYVAGTTGSADAMLQRLDLDGGNPAMLRFDPASTDYAFAAAADDTGAYLAGTKMGDSLGQVSLGAGDAFLVKVAHPPLIHGIADAFTGQPGLASSTWIALYGENLTESTRTWDGAIVGTQLPRSLDGTSVTVNGRAAAIHFISPRQVNILAPLDEATGNVRVSLENPYGISRAFELRKTEFLPAFYAPFSDARGLAVTAVALDGTLVGAPGVDPRVRRAARPGEIVLLFATGFGATIPAVPTDALFLGAPAVAVRPRITIGGKEADMIGSGNLVGPGLYQFNVTVPDLPDGDHPVVAEIGSARSLPSVILAVRR